MAVAKTINERNNRTMPSTRSSLCLPGDPPKSPYPDFRRIREIVALLEPGQETVIKDIPATWAAQVIESVEAQGTRKEISLRFSPHIPREEQLTLANHNRSSYNSLTSSLLVRPMPTDLHSSCQEWLVQELLQMAVAGWLTPQETLLLNFSSGTSKTFHSLALTNLEI